MIQNVNFSPIRNTVPINSKFLPAPQIDSGTDFRDVLATNKHSSIFVAISSGSERDKFIDAIHQAKIFTPSAFKSVPAGAVREPFNIQNHYTMPPEDVKEKLNRLEEEIQNTNLFNMTKKQTYELIENKFIEAFGEDFMLGYKLLLIVPGSGMNNDPDMATSNYEYVEIGNTFHNLMSNSIGFKEMQEIYREKKYGDKSDMEIIDTLISERPQRLTNRCLALITAEMYSVGMYANIGFGTYTDNLFAKFGDDTMSDWSDFEAVWNNLLDKPANIQEMAFSHNTALVLEGKNPFVLQVKDILVKLGAELGPNGLFLDPDGNPFVELNVAFGSLDSDDLFDEFRDDLEKHDESLREAKELLENHHDFKEVSGLYASASDNFHNSITSTSDIIL